MHSVLNTLLSEQLLAFWVLLAVVYTERYLPWLDKYHPISFIKVLATGMQAKVLTPEQDSARQQKISGSFGCIVLLLPFCALLMVFKYLAEFPIFFEALMLLVALRFQDIAKQTRRVSVALAQHKKMLARHALAQIVIRETNRMSPLGMVKANIESLLLRYSYQYCSVIFWYLIAGGVGALIYRLTFELSLVWNVKLSRYRYFGHAVRQLTNVLQWLPSKLASLSVMLAVNISRGSSALFQRLTYQCNHFFVLNLCGASLNIELGGPAYYDQKVVRSKKCGGTRQVVLADNIRTLNVLSRATWVWLTGYFMSCALSFLVAR